ncbi:MAG TPA: PAS domain S-box protein [Candidatus Sulfotelmatobacter sp.]|nr:PAS domain S-box protein [Candidatus Sulfotelmatobacter sp.]
MSQPLRILLVEDSRDDAELLLRELRRGGYQPLWERVESAQAMRRALENSSWDLVISDYVMPGFDGLEALALVQAMHLEVPFLLVSGHIGEEMAVAALKTGANDYLMKDRLARLVPTVRRTLQEAETRRAHRQANDALRQSEERFRQLAENIGAAFFMFEQPNGTSLGLVSYVSPAYERIWGYPCESLFWDASLWLQAIYPEDRQRVITRLPRMAKGQVSEEFRIHRMDLQSRWVHLRTFPVRNPQGEVYRVAAIAEDITERKAAEEQLAANARQLQNTIQELRATDEQLRQKNHQLLQAGAELEKRVQERTADLQTANAELQAQINERKRLENELLEIAENERRRIGFDLHDDLGQKLMGISLLLKAMEKSLAQKQVAEANDTHKVQGLIDQVISHTHNLASCFSSLEAPADDLNQLIRKLITSVRRTFHITCSFHGPEALPALPQELTLQLYKITQESISNAIRHGKARHVVISVAAQSGRLVLQIKNDGVPFPVSGEPSDRMGLRIMNYRAHTIGGVLEVQPNGHSGTLVTCTVPYANGHKTVQLTLEAEAPPAPAPPVPAVT